MDIVLNIIIFIWAAFITNQVYLSRKNSMRLNERESGFLELRLLVISVEEKNLHKQFLPERLKDCSKFGEFLNRIYLPYPITPVPGMMLDAGNIEIIPRGDLPSNILLITDVILKTNYTEVKLVKRVRHEDYEQYIKELKEYGW